MRTRRAFVVFAFCTSVTAKDRNAAAVVAHNTAHHTGMAASSAAAAVHIHGPREAVPNVHECLSRCIWLRRQSFRLCLPVYDCQAGIFVFLQGDVRTGVNILFLPELVVIIGIMVLHQKSVAQLPPDNAIDSRHVNDLCAARVVSVSRRRLEETL